MHRSMDYHHLGFLFVSVFKIFGIEDDQFVEKVNLRVGKNLNLNFSASDVAWNPNDGKCNRQK